MEGMTELMEECFYIVHRKERRSSGGRFGEVAYIDDDGTMVDTVLINILWTYILHPCSRTLAGAWEIVGIEYANKLIIFISYFEYLYIFVVHGHVAKFFELESV